MILVDQLIKLLSKRPGNNIIRCTNLKQNLSCY